MENAVLDRVIKVLEYSKLSKRAFAEKINIEQSTVNNQILGKRSISFDLIQNILRIFSEVSSDWLILGIGDMIKQQKDFSQVDVRSLEDEIIALRAENNLLREQLGLKHLSKPIV